MEFSGSFGIIRATRPQRIHLFYVVLRAKSLYKDEKLTGFYGILLAFWPCVRTDKWPGEGTCEWWILLSYLWGKEASQNQYFLKFIISFIRFFA